ncbi:MAG: IS21-like element helper ATPase IstB [Rectinemataceae bacterium]
MKEFLVNNTATLEKMRLLKLFGMERAFRSILESAQDQALSTDELLAHVTDAEWDDRINRKTRRLTKAAGFRTRAAFPEIDFSIARGLDRNAFLRLSDCSWISAGKSIVISGPIGVGKSYLCLALGSQACALGHRTLYFNCTELFQTLKEKRASGGYQRFIGRVARTPLLILDDFGLVHLDAQDRLALLEIIEDRLARNATVIATQIPIAKWFDIIGDPTIADAVCDRIVPQATRITLSGKSMRAIKGEKEQSEACVNSAT